ncbi:MAG: hypothetical protein NZM16_01660, partial [Thermoflexus sp.]
TLLVAEAINRRSDQSKHPYNKGAMAQDEDFVVGMRHRLAGPESDDHLTARAEVGVIYGMKPFMDPEHERVEGDCGPMAGGYGR